MEIVYKNNGNYEKGLKNKLRVTQLNLRLYHKRDLVGVINSSG